VKQLVILSGKGGTGKTTVAAALAHLASQDVSIVLVDADVDAANLELVLSPAQREAAAFFSSKVAVIDPQLCTACGTCEEVCRFDAVTAPDNESDSDIYTIDPVACEGCAVCYYQCPAEAIRMEEPQDGVWFLSDTPFGPLVHAHLFAGQENSGKLVSEVREQARKIASAGGQDYIIIDGPPGIGCPVIAAATGVNLVLVVIEPTVSGIHDLERVLGVTEHFKIPALMCINKYDINVEKAQEITHYCAQRGIEVVGRIPFDTVVTEAMVHGKPVTDYEDGTVSEELRKVWKRVQAALVTLNRKSLDSH
jgi:MinD superfamily P-loop ATPase